MTSFGMAEIILLQKLNYLPSFCFTHILRLCCTVISSPRASHTSHTNKMCISV